MSETGFDYRTGRTAVLSGLETPFTVALQGPCPPGWTAGARVPCFSSLDGRRVPQAPLPGQAPTQAAQQAVAEGLQVTPSGQGYSLVGIQAGKLYCPIMAFSRIFLILFVVPIGTISVAKSIICKINPIRISVT